MGFSRKETTEREESPDEMSGSCQQCREAWRGAGRLGGTSLSSLATPRSPALSCPPLAPFPHTAEKAQLALFIGRFPASTAPPAPLGAQFSLRVPQSLLGPVPLSFCARGRGLPGVLGGSHINFCFVLHSEVYEVGRGVLLLRSGGKAARMQVCKRGRRAEPGARGPSAGASPRPRPNHLW